MFLFTGCRNSCIVCNSVQPSRKPAISFKSIQYPKSLHKNILRQFFCILFSSDNFQNEPIYTLTIPIYQTGKKFSFPVQHFLYIVCIVQFVHVALWTQFSKSGYIPESKIKKNILAAKKCNLYPTKASKRQNKLH